MGSITRTLLIAAIVCGLMVSVRRQISRWTRGYNLRMIPRMTYEGNVSKAWDWVLTSSRSRDARRPCNDGAASKPTVAVPQLLVLCFERVVSVVQIADSGLLEEAKSGQSFVFRVQLRFSTKFKFD